VITHKFGIPLLTHEEIHQLTTTITQYEARDRLLKETADAKNEVETFVYNGKDFLTEEAAIAVSTEQEREDLLDVLEHTGLWLEDEGENAHYDAYVSKLKYLKEKAGKIIWRVEEQKKIA